MVLSEGSVGIQQQGRAEDFPSGFWWPGSGVAEAEDPSGTPGDAVGFSVITDFGKGRFTCCASSVNFAHYQAHIRKLDCKRLGG